MASRHSATTNHSTGENGRQRGNIPMAQNVLLIWLDNSIDEKNSDCQNILAQLRRVINAVSTFTETDECIEFITNNSNNEKICMIISGALGQSIIPSVHNMSQVDSIFIFRGNRKRQEQWAKEWPKIKGVFSEISPICKALKGAAQQCEHNAIGMSFMSTSGGASNTASDQLDCSFMYTQIMKEILLTIQFEEQHIQEYIDYCRKAFAKIDIELNNIRKLERTYRKETPIWWYTLDCFLYRMLNCALRTMDVNIIIMMGFFITDLHCHIERLHVEQFGSYPESQELTVYRGQGMSKIDFDQLEKTKGGLMSFNNFLSTSKNRNVSLDFARNAISNPDMVGILFVMSIDPSLTSTPFASIADASYFKTEDEILFSMHTIFRIREIKALDDNNRLWQVELTLTSDNDKDLRALTGRIREETSPGSEGWERLGSLLLKMGHPDKAHQIYETIRQQTSDEDRNAAIYNQLGWAKGEQGLYEESITFLKKSLEIKLKTLPPTHPDLASSYDNIGLVYCKMGEYSKALLSHEKALDIYQQTHSPTDPELAKCYNNIGIMYKKMGEYSEALWYYEKDLEICKTLPPTHPDLAMSYYNIGNLYYKMGEYSKAVSSYEYAVNIAQQSLPKDHPDLQDYRINLRLAQKKL